MRNSLWQKAQHFDFIMRKESNFAKCATVIFILALFRNFLLKCCLGVFAYFYVELFIVTQVISMPIAWAISKVYL